MFISSCAVISFFSNLQSKVLSLLLMSKGKRKTLSIKPSIRVGLISLPMALDSTYAIQISLTSYKKSQPNNELWKIKEHN